MALGQVVWFNKAVERNGDGQFNLSGATVKAALLTAAVTPDIDDSDPRFGNGGDQDYSATEVTPGGNYVAGGKTMGGADKFTRSGNISTFTAGAISWAPDGSNPTNARWLLIYVDDGASYYALGFVDLGGTYDMTTGTLSLNPHANGIVQFVNNS